MIEAIVDRIRSSNVGGSGEGNGSALRKVATPNGRPMMTPTATETRHITSAIPNTRHHAPRTRFQDRDRAVITPMSSRTYAGAARIHPTASQTATSNAPAAPTPARTPIGSSPSSTSASCARMRMISPASRISPTSPRSRGDTARQASPNPIRCPTTARLSATSSNP
jgi:hypothetical protein